MQDAGSATDMTCPLETWDAVAVQAWLNGQPVLGKYAVLLEVGALQLCQATRIAPSCRAGI